jgi:hypothetical protein
VCPRHHPLAEAGPPGAAQHAVESRCERQAAMLIGGPGLSLPQHGGGHQEVRGGESAKLGGKLLDELALLPEGKRAEGGSRQEPTRLHPALTLGGVAWLVGGVRWLLVCVMVVVERLVWRRCRCLGMVAIVGRCAGERCRCFAKFV